jgi:hypothetical protein
MNIHLSLDEMELLAYLHERARSFDVNGCFSDIPILNDLEWEAVRLTKVKSYLFQWNMIQQVGTPQLFFLTGAGENFMRDLEAQLRQKNELTRTQKLTRAFWSTAKETTQDLVVQIASETLQRFFTG